VARLVQPTETATIVADGECHDSGIESVGFYRAICDPAGDIRFLKNKCSDSACLVCDNLADDIYTGISYESGECTAHTISFNQAWIMYGTCAEPSCVTSTVAPETTSPTTAPETDVFFPIDADETDASFPIDANETDAPSILVEACEWELEYYDLSYGTSAFGTCRVARLVQPTETATIVADGECHDSGIESVGFYRAICDPAGDIRFLKNKCSDSACLVCDNLADDIYTGVSYESGECTAHDMFVNRAWILNGSCACGASTVAPETNSPTTAPETFLGSGDTRTFSLIP
jgi:hypothetical protein